MISGNVPQHLVALARTGFLTAPRKDVPGWARIAAMIDLTQKNQTLVDLGGSPMPHRSRGRFNADDFIEKSLAVAPVTWELPVWISGNAVKDDQTGTLLQRVRAAGGNYDRFLAQQAFKTLNDGDNSALSGLGYDGKALFANDHADPGGKYTTGQDNLDNNALSLANFNTQYTKGQLVRDDQGEFTNYNYDLLVVDPTNRVVAHQICNVPGGQETITNNNPNAGRVDYIVTPMFDTNAWVLVASGESTKPVLIVMRESPHLEDAWKDPEADDGGRFYFNFTARFNFYVGDWRTAQMGKSS